MDVHRRQSRQTLSLPVLILLSLLMLGASCATGHQKRSGGGPRNPKEALALCEARVKQLAEETDQQSWNLIEKDALIRQLEQRLIAQQRMLDDAIQEVVRVKAKHRSLETRAEAASEMAEAEIALKTLRAKAGRSTRPELANAEQLLKMAGKEFGDQNFGGALYLVSQAKGQIKTGTLRLTETDPAGVLEGEIAFAVPLSLKIRSKAHLRSGPGMEFPVVGLLEEGAPVTGHSSKGPWLRVRGGTGPGGWIHRSLVSPS
jgi:hypothetical protein